MLAGSILKPTINEILKPKKYLNPDVQQTIDLLSLGGKSIIMGSYRAASQLYPSDIDLFETVSSNTTVLTTRLKSVIRKIQESKETYLMDIKLGTDEALRIIDEAAYISNGKLYRYDYKKSTARLNEVKDQIGFEKYKLAKKLLVKDPTETQLDKINKQLRFHLLRWSAHEILSGYKKISTGKYSLAKAFKSPTLFKIDIIRFINGMYTDITIIYDLRDSKGIRANIHTINVEESLIDDIRKYTLLGDYFRVLKRKFALSKYRYENKKGLKNKVHEGNNIRRIHAILNSDLGKLYQIMNMVRVVASLIEQYKRLSKDKVLSAISTIISRLNNISTIKHDAIAKELLSILNLTSTSVQGERFIRLEQKIKDLLNTTAKDLYDNLPHS